MNKLSVFVVLFLMGGSVSFVAYGMWDPSWSSPSLASWGDAGPEPEGEDVDIEPMEVESDSMEESSEDEEMKDEQAEGEANEAYERRREASVNPDPYLGNSDHNTTVYIPGGSGDSGGPGSVDREPLLLRPGNFDAAPGDHLASVGYGSEAPVVLQPSAPRVRPSAQGSVVEGLQLSTEEVEALNAELMKYINQQNVEVVRGLIKAGAQVNAVVRNDGNFFTSRATRPLELALYLGDSGIVRCLLENGANINFLIQGSSNAYLFARLPYLNADILQLLKGHGVDFSAFVNDCNQTGIPSLHYAAREGHLERVRFFVGEGADVNLPNQNTRDDRGFGRTPLHYAAINGHENVVYFLLENGANVNAVDGLGQTPLHLAAHGGFLEVVKLLVCWHARVNTTTLIEGRQEASVFNGHDFYAHGTLAAMNVILNRFGRYGRTPLHYAAISGHVNIVHFLLENGADLGAVDCFGRTPLDLAAGRIGLRVGESDTLEVVNYLTERGAVLAGNDYAAQAAHRSSLLSALMLAAQNGNLEIMESLFYRVGPLDINEFLEGYLARLYPTESESYLYPARSVNNLFPAANRDRFFAHAQPMNLPGSWPGCLMEGVCACQRVHYQGLYEANYRDIFTRLLDCSWDLQSWLRSAVLERVSSKNIIRLYRMFYWVGGGDLVATDVQELLSWEFFEFAVRENSLGALRLLFRLKAAYYVEVEVDLNALDAADGSGLLHIAAEKGNKALFEALLESDYPFDLDLRQAGGKTALQILRENGHEDIAGFLIKKGATDDAQAGEDSVDSGAEEVLVLEDEPNSNAAEDREDQIEEGDVQDLGQEDSIQGREEESQPAFVPGRARKAFPGKPSFWR